MIIVLGSRTITDITAVSWLMVLDNVENENLARSCWPVASHGSVLVTSRRHVVSFEVATIGVEVKQFSDEVGGSILRRLVGSRSPSSEGSAEEVISAEELSKEVGGLGLALGVIAAQVSIKGMSFTNFVGFYKRNATFFHDQTRAIGGQQYCQSLHTCWSTSFSNLGHNAFTILAALSFLGSDHIPTALFQPGITMVTRPEGLKFLDKELE